ncbi:hypothetical protein BD309DRAFT_956983, partial [Dichomitus squalens]
VWHICDFPVRNSPNSSVIAPVSMPPPRRASRFFEPVVMCTSSARRACTSVALWKPRGMIFKASGREAAPSAKILSAFCSEMPLMAIRFFFGVYATDSTVFNPASVSFLISCGVMPHSASLSTRRGPETWTSSSSWSCEGDGELIINSIYQR